MPCCKSGVVATLLLSAKSPVAYWATPWLCGKLIRKEVFWWRLRFLIRLVYSLRRSTGAFYAIRGLIEPTLRHGSAFPATRKWAGRELHIPPTSTYRTSLTTTLIHNSCVRRSG